MTYGFERHDGVRCGYNDDLDDVELFGALVKAKTQDRLLARAREQCRDDGADFGDLRIHAQRGITYLGRGVFLRGKRLRWRDCTGLRVHDGHLMIGRVGKLLPWVTVPVEQLPNAHVLFALLRELGRTR